MLAPGGFLELIRDRRDTAAAVANATTALTNGLSATNQKFVFILFISSIRKSAFHKTSNLFPEVRNFSLVGGDFSPVWFAPDGFAVASLDFTSCDHALPFITIQCPLSSGGSVFRGNGDAKRASALAAATINSVATIALVFINDSLTRIGKLYCHDESDVFRRADD
jgi:hypothetical protein